MKAQDWLDQNYPPGSSERKTAEWIHVWHGDADFEGSLKIEGFEKVGDISIHNRKLPAVEISNCPELDKIELGSNEINSFSVSGCDKLWRLELSNNNLTSIDFLKIAIGGGIIFLLLVLGIFWLRARKRRKKTK